MKLKSIQEFARALVDPTLAPTAFKVALIVGSILFIINHGIAVIEGKMTQQLIISGIITYFVPYCINIHGQYVSRNRISKVKTQKRRDLASP